MRNASSVWAKSRRGVGEVGVVLHDGRTGQHPAMCKLPGHGRVIADPELDLHLVSHERQRKREVASRSTLSSKRSAHSSLTPEIIPPRAQSEIVEMRPRR